MLVEAFAFLFAVAIVLGDTVFLDGLTYLVLVSAVYLVG